MGGGTQNELSEDPLIRSAVGVLGRAGPGRQSGYVGRDPRQVLRARGWNTDPLPRIRGRQWRSSPGSYPWLAVTGLPVGRGAQDLSAMTRVIAIDPRSQEKPSLVRSDEPGDLSSMVECERSRIARLVRAL
jgi:hypothetical protein